MYTDNCLPVNEPKSNLIRFHDRDLTICGREGDPYFEHLTLGIETNDFLLSIAKEFVCADAVIFDIGANIGVTSAVLATAAHQGHIYSFEPSPRVFPFLAATIKINGLTNCTPLKLALGANKGELSFFDNPISASASHLSLDQQTLGGSNCTVSVTTVDNFVRDTRIGRLDLIKIDVEGFELEVLSGAKDTIARLRPNVFVEFNSFTLIAYGNENPRHVLECLLDTFPHVYRFEGGIYHEIRDKNSILSFIHDNLIKHGCVDDLYCCHNKLPF